VPPERDIDPTSQSPSSRAPFAAGAEPIVISDGRDPYGMPIYWRWDPNQLDPRTRTKMQQRHAHGYTDPPLQPPSVRTELEDRIRDCDDEIAALNIFRPTLGARSFTRGEAQSTTIRRRDALLAELYGKDFKRYPRQIVHKIAAPLDPTARITLALGERVPPAFIVGGALVIGMNMLLPGHMLFAVILGCVLTALAVGGSAAARWWADNDPLLFTEDDRSAIEAGFELITVPTSLKGTSEYNLATRAVDACDRIGANRAWSTSYLDEHRTLLDPESELREMISHAHQLTRVRQALGREPQGDDIDARLAHDAFHSHDRAIAEGTDYLRRRVEMVESYADHLDDLDRQLENLDAVRRAADATSTVDALARYDALADLSTAAISDRRNDLDQISERISAQLDVLRRDLDGFDRLIATTADHRMEATDDDGNR
jgi:hypothetical protein